MRKKENELFEKFFNSCDKCKLLCINTFKEDKTFNEQNRNLIVKEIDKLLIVAEEIEKYLKKN
jgi:deoxyadenosine/deoxycytidine kinase